MKANEIITEKWSEKYKRSIDCSRPKGFSQRAHCRVRKKNTKESVLQELAPSFSGEDDDPLWGIIWKQAQHLKIFTLPLKVAIEVLSNNRVITTAVKTLEPNISREELLELFSDAHQSLAEPFRKKIIQYLKKSAEEILRSNSVEVWYDQAKDQYHVAGMHPIDDKSYNWIYKYSLRPDGKYGLHRVDNFDESISLQEVSKDWRERSSAEDKIGKIVASRKNWDQFTIDDINEIKKLIKITGRASVIYGGKGYDRLGTAGGILDRMIHNYRLNQAKSGKMPQFTGSATTARDMARQIAMQTNGRERQRYAIVWTTGYGQRYKDPSDFIEYKTEEDYDSAWDWVQSKGKKVYYYDHFKHLNTAIKIGKYIIEPASYTRNAFGNNPETTHRISVRTARIINQAVRTQADISDQQAAQLKDIAATKSANAVEGLKLLLNLFKGEEDIKSIIDNSKKIDSKDKAKLDQIIAGAKDFKDDT
jgi:hypothetical protein